MLLVNLIALAAAFATTWALVPLIARLTRFPKLLHRSEDGVRRPGAPLIPRLGGVAVFAGTVFAVIVALLLRDSGLKVPTGWTSLAPLMIPAATIVFVLGLADDVRGVPPSAKLIAQTLAAGAAWSAGVQVETLAFPPGTVVHLGAWSLPVTVIWIVGISNALNLVDGLDGLAGTVTLIALLALAGAAIVLNHNGVLLLASAMFGATAAFLRFNWHPARIFLGDSGALVIGFMLAVATVESSRRPDGAVLTLVPVLALAYPILDTAIAILRRFLRREPFARADGRHIHQQLIALGYAQPTAVRAIGAFSFAMAALALAVTFASPARSVLIALVTLGMLIAFFAWGLRWLQYDEFTEASAAVLHAARSGRDRLRLGILVRDVERRLARATDARELDELLAASAAELGLVHLRICRESARRRLPASADFPVVDMYKVEVAVATVDASQPPDPVVLRVWARHAEGGAERVARMLAPAVRERLSTWSNADNLAFFPHARARSAPAPIPE